MEELKLYLSHSMGVNSTALMILLEDMGFKFESVFVELEQEKEVIGTPWEV